MDLDMEDYMDRKQVLTHYRLIAYSLHRIRIFHR